MTETSKLIYLLLFMTIILREKKKYFFSSATTLKNTNTHWHTLHSSTAQNLYKSIFVSYRKMNNYNLFPLLFFLFGHKSFHRRRRITFALLLATSRCWEIVIRLRYNWMPAAMSTTHRTHTHPTHPDVRCRRRRHDTISALFHTFDKTTAQQRRIDPSNL